MNKFVKYVIRGVGKGEATLYVRFCMKLRILTILLTTFISVCAFCEDATIVLPKVDPEPEEPEKQIEECEAKELKQKVDQAKADLKTELTGFGFSAGLGALFMGGDGYIENAWVDTEGILRVEEQSDVRIGGMMEVHYMWGDARFNGKKCGLKKSLERKLNTKVKSVVNDTALGISIGVELGDDFIRSAGIGPMISFRRFDMDTNGNLTPKGNAFNLAIMAFVESDVRQLASGLSRDMLLPEGDVIRFQERSESGVAVLFSANF